MEIFVFDNSELYSASEKGCRSIALCDNSFNIPKTPGIKYWSLGNTDITAPPKDFCEANGIRFMNFTPHYSEKKATAPSGGASGIAAHPAKNTGATAGNAVSSFTEIGFSSAFGLLSSHTYRSSLTGSFASSLSGSFQSSLTGSFASSLSGSLSSALAGSFSSESDFAETADIKVFGYGIDLI